MKVALVHDYLIQYGGAERVLETLMRMFPAAPIYTLLYDGSQSALRRFEGRVRKTAFLDWPLVRKRHRLFIPLMPLAVRSLTLPEDCDLVISDSAGFAKGIRFPSRTFHLAYCHTPLRYAWETDSYFTGRLLKFFGAPAFTYLRAWDFRAAQKPHRLLANSRHIARKVKRYYGREATVVYPPVDTAKFFYDRTVPRGDYFLAAGRLLHYKRFDLVVDAFRALRLPLKIVGSGPLLASLRARIGAHRQIELIPFVEDGAALRRLYGGARAFIFPHVEDFGLVAAEALACGTPVIAFAAGGALEIVEEGVTGIFFREPTAASLAAAVERFTAREHAFDRARVGERGARFSAERFRKAFHDALPRELH